MIDTPENLRQKTPTLCAGWLPDAPHPGLQEACATHEASVRAYEIAVATHASVVACGGPGAGFRAELRQPSVMGVRRPDSPDAAVADAPGAVAREEVAQAGLHLAHVARWAVREFTREQRGVREVLEVAFAATTSGSWDERALNAERWVALDV